MFFIYEINMHLPHTKMLGTCVGVIAWQVRKIDALNSVLLMTQWILCPACVCMPEITIDKRGGNVRGWLFSQYDSFFHNPVVFNVLQFICILMYFPPRGFATFPYNKFLDHDIYWFNYPIYYIKIMLNTLETTRISNIYAYFIKYILNANGLYRVYCTLLYILMEK